MVYDLNINITMKDLNCLQFSAIRFDIMKEQMHKK